MILASLYIVACSARNRLRVRLRRLREPRYLVGAIVGAAYMYFTVFARIRGRARAGAARGGPRGGRAAMWLLAVPGWDNLVGLPFLAAAALAWLLPFPPTMLDFTDAEVQFLLPAPVTRRQLLIHRVTRSQLGLLFTATVSALVFGGAAWPGRLRFAIGMWVILLTARLYYTGVSLARARLTSPGSGPRWAAWVPPVVIGTSVVTIATILTIEFAGRPPSGLTELATRGVHALNGGAARIALWPWLALARPLLATSISAFLGALALALSVLVVTFAWVLRVDDAMLDVAARASDRQATSAAGRTQVLRARATGLTLAQRGRPEWVFFWKNGVQMLRAGGATLVRYVIPFVGIVSILTSFAFSATHRRGGAAAAFFIAGAVAAFSTILGPLMVRADLRSDLRHLEVLKTWPVRPAAVVRGEMLWPIALLSGISWLAIACAALFSAAGFPNVPLAARLAYAVSALLVAPALVIAQYLVQSAAAVFFPAWVPQGDQRPRGLDAMGQRMIMLGGVLLSVAILFFPGVLAGGVIWLAFSSFLGLAALVPAAAACAIIVAVETLVCTEALGPVFERLDLMAVERGE